ncbi:MAG: asparagine synthase (glutamine-hydrolyzing) [Chitinophagaceae bacterium]
MCGIAGIIGTEKINDVVQKMQQACNALQHRGPNSQDYYVNNNNNVALAHTRLSIIDLSKNANQPFKYLNYVAVYNGEIYNFNEIKIQLQKNKYQFSTQSDTEVLIAAYDNWGAKCLDFFDGMFAFVIYNTNNQTVFAARDAFGEKPFYYNIDNKKFTFSSEIGALFTLGVSKNHNITEWINYITLGHTSNANDKSTTFYENIVHLPQGHYIEFVIEDNLKIEPKQWFKLQNIEVNYSHFDDQFKHVFETAIAKKLQADVPIATSLSGGVDSSCIVTAIHNVQQKSNYSFKTFTASFDGFYKDETEFSKSICNSLSIQQTLVQPNVNDLINDLSALLNHQQEPTQSTSVFTQWMVYKAAAIQGIKVIIDGQGADELLGGYSKQMEWFLVFLKKENPSLFKTLATELQKNDFVNEYSIVLKLASSYPSLVQKMANFKNSYLANHNSILNKDFTASYFNKLTTQKPIFNSFKDLLYYHSTTFGLPSLLRFADRNAMAFGLEVRLPFLSKDVAPFLFHLPNTVKVKNGFTKHLLRNYLANNNLPNIAWRKGKIGFEPPQQQWMQNQKLQQIVVDIKQKLLKEKIISNQYAKTPVKAVDAHNKLNTDWRILNMGLLLFNK